MAGIGDLRSAEAPSRNPFDKAKFVAHLYDNADKKGFGHGKCATNVRDAIEAAGMQTRPNPLNAKDYGNFLMGRLFFKVAKEGYVPRIGDIVVFNVPPASHHAGHIQGFDGKQWVSDHVQHQGFFPHHAYKQAGVNYEIYRRR
jgi:hypothetical protein